MFVNYRQAVKNFAVLAVEDDYSDDQKKAVIDNLSFIFGVRVGRIEDDIHHAIGVMIGEVEED